MRILIDTNVLISAALNAAGTPFQAYVKATSYPNHGLICEQNINEMKYSVKVIKPIIEQIKKAITEERQIYLEGANKSFELPEFHSLEVAKNFVNIIDEKDLVADMLDSGFAQDINVYIGDENEKEELKDFSIVTFKHKVGNKDLGTIGIIGPKRMNYSKVISVMKYISKKLNEKDV